VPLLCFAHHAVRLWCAPRRWPCGATSPVQICWKLYTFPSLVPGKMTFFDNMEPLCTATQHCAGCCKAHESYQGPLQRTATHCKVHQFTYLETRSPQGMHMRSCMHSLFISVGGRGWCGSASLFFALSRKILTTFSSHSLWFCPFLPSFFSHFFPFFFLLAAAASRLPHFVSLFFLLFLVQFPIFFTMFFPKYGLRPPQVEQTPTCDSSSRRKWVLRRLAAAASWEK